MSLSVSIICACRNERRHITAFLDSLMRQQTGRITWEAVIADGMSSDGTREILAAYSRQNARIRVIDNPAKIVAPGLNAAIREARGDIIIRMDAHTEYASDYIQRSVEALVETGADNVGGAPRVRPDDFRARLFGAAYHSHFAVGGARSHDASYEGYVDSVFYGCWYKSTLERLGLFDEALVRNQDDELNLRLIRSGGKVYQSAKIVSWYSPRRTVRSLFRQYFEYGFWKVAVIRKHHRPAAWRHIVPGIFVAAQLTLLLVLAAAILFKSASTWTLLAFLLSVWTVYGASCILAALKQARRAGLAAIFLPALFAIYHFSYGAGFLAGLGKFGFQKKLR